MAAPTCWASQDTSRGVTRRSCEASRGKEPASRCTRWCACSSACSEAWGMRSWLTELWQVRQARMRAHSRAALPTCSMASSHACNRRRRFVR